MPGEVLKNSVAPYSDVVQVDCHSAKFQIPILSL
jgi:hypothetical protein